MSLISLLKNERFPFRFWGSIGCIAVTLAAGTALLIRKETQSQKSVLITQMIAAQLCSDGSNGNLQQRGFPTAKRETYFAIAKREFRLKDLSEQRQPQDFEQAVLAYHRGAAIGDPDALHNMGIIFANGIAVVQDDLQALKWLLIASSVKRSNDTTALIEQVESRIAPEKRVEALRRSKDWWIGRTVVVSRSGL